MSSSRRDPGSGTGQWSGETMIPWRSVAGPQSWKTGIVEAPVGSPVKIGNGAIVSHGAIVHGATIGDNALVGIGAIVLDGVDVGPTSIIGAGAIVPPRVIILPNTLALGIPAMPVREVRAREGRWLPRRGSGSPRRSKSTRKHSPGDPHFPLLWGKVNAEGHSSTKTHAPQSGFLAAQTLLPCSMRR